MLNQSLFSSHSKLISQVRSLILCFSIFFALLLLSHRIHLAPSSLHPVLKVSRLSLLSSSTSNSLLDSSSSESGIRSPVRIEDRVLFPDHILLLLSNSDSLIEELECVYDWQGLNYSDGVTTNEVVLHPVLSLNDYDEFRSVARCPLPPENYSIAVNLRRRGVGDSDVVRNDWFLGPAENQNQTVHSWEKVVYAALIDGDTAVVFVKGLNLRPNRDWDPSRFSCHFRSHETGISVKTTAIKVAQEVVRCLIPRSMRNSPAKAEGIRVTIGVNRIPLPSVAKIVTFNSDYDPSNVKTHELCVCTMVWNQAASLREWIIYHSFLGVERWIIYDNNSDDDIKEVIQELELNRYNISRQTWPWIKTQEAGFSHCALRARRECKWVSFMDVDEFFYFPWPTLHHRKFDKLGFPGKNSLRSLVNNFSNSTKIAEIRTSCHSFGPSGLNTPPSEGKTVGYTCRLQSPERHKSIVRPDALDHSLLNVVHHFRLRKGFKYINLPQNTALINHYKYQVWESFRAKFFRRVATYVADWQENQNEGSKDRAPGLGTEPIEPPDWRLKFCEVWDTGLRDFVLANMVDSATGLLPWETSL